MGDQSTSPLPVLRAAQKVTALGKGVKLETSLETLWWISGTWDQPGACGNNGDMFSWLRAPITVLTCVKEESPWHLHSCWDTWGAGYNAVRGILELLPAEEDCPMSSYFLLIIKKSSSGEKGNRFLRKMSLAELAHNYKAGNILTR